MPIPGSNGMLAQWAYGIYHMLQQIYWRLAGGRTEVVFGDRFRFEPSTHFPSFVGLHLPKRKILSTIVRYGDYVQTHAAYRIVEETKHPPVVVDVGAHHGIYAILLGKAVQRKKGVVVAIEPNPASFRILRRNVQLNKLEDTVRCENIGIMDRRATVRIDNEDDQSRIDESGALSGFKVEAFPLSQILEKHSLPSVDVLIIDVEGAELNVLRGIDWKKFRFGAIFCELHPYHWRHFQYTGSDVAEFLSLHGYRCFDMYLKEHVEFSGEGYIGPTLFVPVKAA